MRTRDLLIVGAWALSTVAALVAVSPVSLDANNDSKPAVTPAIETPTLKANGCELSLDWLVPPAKDGAKPGKVSAVKLVMLNPGKETAFCPWKVRLLVTPSSDPMSRVMPTPKESWSQQDEYSLLPGERKELVLHPDTVMAAGERGFLAIESKGQSINALSMFVKREAVTRKLAAADLAPQQSMLADAVRNDRASKQ